MQFHRIWYIENVIDDEHLYIGLLVLPYTWYNNMDVLVFEKLDVVLEFKYALPLQRCKS